MKKVYSQFLFDYGFKYKTISELRQLLEDFMSETRNSRNTDSEIAGEIYNLDANKLSKIMTEHHNLEMFAINCQ